MKPSILLVDDDPGIQSGFKKYLSKKGYAVATASSLAEARELAAGGRIDAVLLDLALPDGNGIEWIADLRADRPDLAIVVITGTGDVPSAVEAMRQGADNFLTKPVSMPDLEVFLQKCLELESLRRKQLATDRLRDRDGPFFGSAPAARYARDLAGTAAANDAPVLLLGETGTGKGVLAEWIHDQSSRQRAAFVDINCSALGGDLLASELFGHVKGAFTSALQDRQGLVEVADGGTLFLDEIGDMDLGVQAKLLKTLEEKRFRRVGDVKVRASEFRLVCATNRDLAKECESGRFRQDLYYRISVFPVQLPALRECSADLPGLVRHLLAALGKPDAEVPDDAMRLLCSHPWPGNIRELKNVLERALLLSGTVPLSARHFSALQAAGRRTTGDAHSGHDEWDVQQVEMDHIQQALGRFGGDMTKTAKALGISRSTLYRKLKRQGDA